MEITIKDRDCMICGKQVHHGDRVRAHLIPKSLKPKMNVFAFFHKECEQKINSLYVNQEKKSEHERAKKKMLNILKDFKMRIKSMEDRINE